MTFRPASRKKLPATGYPYVPIWSPDSVDLVIEHVTVIPMTPPPVTIPDATVVIHEGKIAAISRHAIDRVDGGAQRINGKGKWLMPALTDAHVHLENDRLLRLFLSQPHLPEVVVRTDDALLPYVANGILQIFDLSAMSETLVQRAEVGGARRRFERGHLLVNLRGVVALDGQQHAALRG